MAVGVAAVAMFAIIGASPALAKPASTSGPGCPGPKGIQGLQTDSNVGYSAVTDNSGVTTYKLFSNDQNAVNGVPGLIKYCVYPTGASAPPTVNVTAKGGQAENVQWNKTTSSKSPYNFSFQRPGGNDTNIWFDEDNETTDMGTATWTGTVPTSQQVVLHVADPSLCGTSPTCFVKPHQAVCNAGDSTVAYNAFPTDFAQGCPLPPSVGFEANGIVEFGNDAGLTATGNGNLQSLKVDFQRYGCQTSGHWDKGGANACVTTDPNATFPSTITARIYEAGAGNTVGDLIASQTKTFNIQYRPSADPAKCPNGDPSVPYDPGSQWFNATTGQCLSSIAQPLTFDSFTAESGKTLTLPSDVIWTVSFNTTHYGYAPIGEQAACFTSNPGCGYDSLNVGVKTYDGAPYSGTNLTPDGVYLNTGPSGAPADPATLAFNSPGWADFLPLGEIITG